MRAAMEEQLRTVTVQDLLLDSIVGIVNLTARRILKEDERDLDQARVGIDAVRGIVDLLEPEQAEGVRRALSELQMHYVQAAGGAPAGATGEQPAGAQQPPPAQPQPGAQQRPQQPSRPGEPPPRLWTPGRGN